ncbi:dihydrodipicolinate synthetase [Beutenbergia cavernae DSM 12333]|uniref:Dihydrodipicolinate synthetase n=1 Tax=Beutenbergia cavernae (strain ATCC BAA-8 / DSM 12333 / CCUG 43141 / JCM 11478 / NBRC 16432 / NCIMB 13614 / HKI 0122) TaxID=471853 RepID=C5C369_BEUC1|nr:dihydrodipicolinate synthase family protein [Beutenbergia cavernae]ACQ79768.1 dihydrodipicolinate synthetase [Beutenbergia cavernae DSM 12333]
MSSNHAGPTGVICPIVTPLTDDERLDREVLAAHVRAVLPHVDGLMALGTTGELPVLDDAVADELVDVVLSEVGDAGGQIVLGVGGAGWARTRRNLRRVADGVTHVAVCAPFYYATTPAGLLDYFRRAADAAAVPVVLYNIPQNTHVPLTVDLVATLAEHENVVGIKDSGPSREYFTELLALRSPSFTVLRGTDDAAVLEYRAAGADGFVSGLENIEPGLLRAALEAGDDDARAAAVARIGEIAALADGATGLSAIKAAVAILRGGSPRAARPVPTLEADALRDLAARLEVLGLRPHVAVG